MRIPTATYRIQFNPHFKFNAAQQIIPYLAELGISDLYASPIFKATPGSLHGYDVVDPNQLNPELGSVAEFDAIAQVIQQHQMGWLQDIVPNHMAYHSENRYLMDVLQNGPESPCASHFDLAWNASFGNNQEPILTPLLGNFYGECLANGELQLKYDESGLSINYYALSIPLRLESYSLFLSYNLGQVARSLGRKHPDFIKLLGILYMLKSIPAESSGKQRQDQEEFVKSLLWELYSGHAEVRTFVDQNIQTFNGEPGNLDSFNLLDQLLSEQFFRLSYWKVGAEEINYRRFFTVNELISVKVEDPKVFKHSHQLILQYVQEGKFTGLRVDHIDGLFNPTEYLDRLRNGVGETYVTVEKILQAGENLPANWSVQGTSGYDFLNYLNSIFCNFENRGKFTTLYQNFIENQTPFEQIVADKKQLILDKNLAGDLDNLAVLLKKISSRYKYSNDFTLNGLKRSIAEVLIQFPIYRTYTTQDGVLESDRPYIETVIQAAKNQVPLLHHELEFIEKLLLLEFEETLTQTEKEQWLYFVMRMQQYTGPLMAKGVEDTALYVYNRLLSLNEVGGNPDHFGIDRTTWHEFNRDRQAHWHDAMNASATHDTKRGEDLRARLNVLSEIPDEWQEQVQKWSHLNQSNVTQLKRLSMPDRNDEYAFYQTLVGVFPFDRSKLDETLRERVKQYAIKAIREAKVYTAWLRPNTAYEEACTKFIDALLATTEGNQFLEAFLPFQQRIAFYGMFNSLSQTLLKIVSPGIPDIYQGTELWDFSLVDPDNRRPVDFALRQEYLRSIQAGIQSDIDKLITELLSTKEDGRIKLFLILQALKARSKYLEVFQQGEYVPLAVQGTRQNHVIAFARRTADTTVIAIAPRFFTTLIQPGANPLGHEVWQDTCVKLPEGMPDIWRDAIGHQVVRSNGVLPIGEALQQFPVALLVSS